MLRHFWTDPAWDVVVLDFDLSWHHGAYEKSVMYGSGTGGYWAPEQVSRIPGVSTRHASVDAFGIGMLCSFVITGEDPVPNNHLHRDWANTITRAARRKRTTGWMSLPNRFSRILLNATQDRQNERWDVSQVHNELSRLQEANRNPLEVMDTDLIAEEMAARSGVLNAYQWVHDELTAMYDSPIGLSVRVSGIPSKRQIIVELTQSQIGHQRWRRGTDRRATVELAAEALKTGGWTVQSTQSRQMGKIIGAYVDVEDAVAGMDALVSALDSRSSFEQPR